MRALLLAALVLLAAAAPAHAAVLNGKYLQNCPLANTGQVDPLVSPGGVADHFHAEFGAKTWGASTTTADMLSGDTTCFNATNKAAYWVSCFDADDGSPICPTSASGYYGAFGADTTQIAGGKVYPYPQGLRFIVGNSKSATLQSSSIVFWRCDAAGNPTLSAPPQTCPAGVGVSLAFNGPRCWDGVSLDSADHRSHMAYGTAASCPVSHPIRIPALLWEFHFPPAAVGKFLDSDHGIAPKGRSAHMDLWEAQDAFGQALETQCLNDPARSSSSSPLCGLFTFTANNGWLANLTAWMGKTDYIAGPSGSAAVRSAP